jgi:hypothetical protein
MNGNNNNIMALGEWGWENRVALAAEHTSSDESFVFVKSSSVERSG